MAGVGVVAEFGLRVGIKAIVDVGGNIVEVVVGWGVEVLTGDNALQPHTSHAANM